MSQPLGRLLDRLDLTTGYRLLGGRFGPAPAVSSIARRIKHARLTYLSNEKLARIERALKDVCDSDIPGCVIECGLALGGSAIVIAASMPEGRAFHGYDVFGMIPPPASDKDDEKSKARYETIRSGRSQGIGGDQYYGYIENVYERVLENFARFGQPVDGARVTLHKGLFQDTLILSDQIAFAHIDCDWYDPVALCLERIVPRLSTGGYVVLDDYNDYGGCRRAVDEFLETHAEVDVIARVPNFVFRKRAPVAANHSPSARPMP